MKRMLCIGLLSAFIINAMAMDKDGEILFLRYFNGSEKIKKFKILNGGKRVVVSKAKDTSTQKVRWQGKVSDLNSGKKSPKPTYLAELDAKIAYKKLLSDHKETEKIYMRTEPEYRNF